MCFVYVTGIREVPYASICFIFILFLRRIYIYIFLFLYLSPTAATYKIKI